MAFENILFEISEGVATITLNRPDKLNSFNVAMHEDLRAAFDELEADETVRCVLLTGAGRGFCAGQDLGDRKFGDTDLGQTLGELYNPLIRRITSLPMPVICAVNGVAAGAGANIAIACDIVLAAKSAKFIQPFCELGLVPDSSGTYNLPRLVGSARAMGLSMLGTPLTADQAVEWGLIWQAIDDDDLMSEATALAQNLATQPTTGLALIKKAIRASFDNDLDTQLELERDYQRQGGETEDYKEGVAAFLEKRAPNFKGK